MDNYDVVAQIKKHKRANSIFNIANWRPKSVANTIVFVLFALYTLSMLLPLIVLLSYSLENKTIYDLNLALGKPFELSKSFDFSNYKYALSEFYYGSTSFVGMFGNSLWYTAISILGPVSMNTAVGYAVAKYKFKARGLYYGIIIFCMTIPVIGTTGAMFKLVSDLGIYDTGPLYVFFTSLGSGGVGFLVMYAFFKNISWEYAEAAFMDGAGHLKVFLKIMVPMAMPAMGALALLSGISAWNAYMEVLLYLPSWPTVASGLYGISRTLPRLGNTPAYYSALVISFIPILVIFSIFSDKIMKNFSVGGLKG